MNKDLVAWVLEIFADYRWASGFGNCSSPISIMAVKRHGPISFMELFIGLCGIFPLLIHQIPLAALAAMLVYILASPKRIYNTYKIGTEQLVIFLVTIMFTFAQLIDRYYLGILLKL